MFLLSIKKYICYFCGVNSVLTITMIIKTIKPYLIAVAACSALFACHTANKDNAYVLAKPPVVYADSVKNLDRVMPGDWSRLGDTTLLFSIAPDSIYYARANASYAYNLKRDSMTIKFDDEMYHARVKMLSKDTMVMIGLGNDKGNIDSVYRNNNAGTDN